MLGPRLRTYAAALGAMAAVTTAGAAGDTVQGTLTVRGRTQVLKYVYVTRASNPDAPGSQYLIVLAADAPIPASSRTRASLADLAGRGGVHAVQVTWNEASGELVATPFHSEVEGSGQPTTGGATIDLRAYDQRRASLRIASRPLGQSWHFDATVDARVVPATLTADDFPRPRPIVAPLVEAEPGSRLENDERTDATSMKQALGRLGFAYTEVGFLQSVNEGNLQAVQLFLRLGMSADTAADGMPLLTSAVMHCTRDPVQSRGDIVRALLAAHASVDPKDENGSTPLLWSVNVGCPVEVVDALIAAGANVNVKARGGATPLMLAQALNRAELVGTLEAAGAKP